jgi:hypothetical protein
MKQQFSHSNGFSNLIIQKIVGEINKKSYVGDLLINAEVLP